jgi:hypothetical protein
MNIDEVQKLGRQGPPSQESASKDNLVPNATWNGLTKVWCQITAGGQPYPPEFYEMFGGPQFLDMEVWPLDHPNNFGRLFPASDYEYGKYGLGQSYLFGFDGKGLPSGPPIPKVEPIDYPWDPSGGREDPGFDVLILNDQLEWPSEVPKPPPQPQPSANSLPVRRNLGTRGNIQLAVAGGKGFVLIHHSLGDNNTWPWWYQQVTGGLLVLNDSGTMKKSTISKSVSLDVRPVGKHPILLGVEPFHLANEESYRGMWQSSNIIPLLETTSTASDKVIAWIGPCSTARVVCIQPGGAAETYRNENFRRLVRNSILWCAGRLGTSQGWNETPSTGLPAT